MGDSSKDYWYVEPLNDITNSTIYEALKDQSADDEELRDSTGRLFRAWEVPSLKFARNLATRPQCKFNLWKKSGAGKPYEVNFLK